MSNNIALTISASDQEVIRALQRTADGVDKVVRRIERLEGASRKQSRSAVSDLGVMAGKFLSVGLAVNVVRTNVQSLIQTNTELRKSTEENARSMDEMARKFRVQAGLSQIDGDAAKKKIQQAAIANSVKPEAAFAAAQQLVSSGFSASDATGGALDSVLKGLSASNADGEAPQPLVQAVGQFLASTGQEKNSANLEKALVAVQRLFKGTDVQLADLTQVASKVSGLATVLSGNEILAGFSVIRETTEDNKAATGLKIFGERLTGAKGDNAREEALSRAGLTPEQVDFRGESFQQVVDLLGQRVEAMAEEDRTPFLQKLFGTEASSAVAALIGGRKLLPDRMAMQGDRAAFAEDAAVNQSGLSAGRRRQEARTQIRQSGGTADFPLLQQAAIEQAIADGSSAVSAAENAKWAEFFHNRGVPATTAIEQGFSPAFGLSGMFGGNRDFMPNVQARVARDQSATPDEDLSLFTPQARAQRERAQEALENAQLRAERNPAAARQFLNDAESAAGRSMTTEDLERFTASIDALRQQIMENTKATKDDTVAVKSVGRKKSAPVSKRLSRESR